MSGTKRVQCFNLIVKLTTNVISTVINEEQVDSARLSVGHKGI